MRVIFLLLVLQVIVCSCGVFKNTSRSNSKSHLERTIKETEILESESESSFSARRESFVKDSVQAVYSMLFWPRGTLTFSPSGGFTGAFDSIQIKGNVYHLRQSGEILELARQKHQQENSTKVYKKNDQLDQTNTIKSSTPSIKMIIIPIFCAILFGVWWFKR